MNITNLIYLTVFVLVLGLSVRTASGQYAFSAADDPGEIVVQVDHADFRSEEPGMNRLEIYYKVFNRGLQFVRDGGDYRADYEVTVTVYGDNNRQITAFSREKSFKVKSFESTVSQDDFRTSQVVQLLPPATYKVEFHVIDKNSGRDTETTFKAELNRFDSRVSRISDVEFVHMIDTCITDSVFRKGGLTVIPLTSREIMGDSLAKLLYYHEIYQGSDSRKNVLIESRILDRKLEKVYFDSVRSEYSEDKGVIRQIRQISLSRMKSGDYYLEILLKNRRNRVVDRVRTPFRLYWSPEALVVNDFETAVTQLKYIADPGDTKKLKLAKTPDEQLAAWNEFWRSRDPSPGTAHNEAKENYYRRIEYSNRHFSVLKKEGWRTDRGMVFIQYGTPDQIEDYPFELNAKAYQIWYYYQLREPRRFVFIDEWGDGDFRLQYPYDGRSY
jgi:GWxTD domain-containing protein